MAIIPNSSPSPRDTLPVLRPHRGVMCFRPDQSDYVKYAIVLGRPNRAGFIPMVKPLGINKVGVIYLKKEGPVESGFYAVTPHDIHRRRVDARPSRKLSLRQATELLGGPVPTDVGPSEDEHRAGTSATPEELVSADLAFKEQVKALQGAEDPEDGI